MLRALQPLDQVRPRAFLTGFGVGFLLLCLLGRLVSDLSYIPGFQRFHRYISIETLYFPTASQMRALARTAASEGQVVVIVGGSSVMHGVGQGSSELWTDEIQRLLGPQYAVLNFAGTGTGMTDGGGVAAQMLYKDGYPVIYVSDLGPIGGIEPDGLRTKYVFWEAYYKGLLPDDARRMVRIDELVKSKGLQYELDEIRVRGYLESIFYQADLWNWVGYNFVFTVPNHQIRLPRAFFVTPRKSFSDPVRVASVGTTEERYGRNSEQELGNVRGIAMTACERNGQGVLVERPAPPIGTTPFDQNLEAALPEDVRRRTVIVLMRESPFYTEKLADDERACYDKTRPRLASRLSTLGFRPVEAGLAMTADDYADRVHLLPSGGRILAGDVSAAIRDLSTELGYVDEEATRAAAEQVRAEADQIRAWIEAGANAPGVIGRLQAQAEILRRRDQHRRAAFREADDERRAAEAARAEAERLLDVINARGGSSASTEELQAQERIAQERVQRLEERLHQVEIARAAAVAARVEVDGLRAWMYQEGPAPDLGERLRALEQSAQERERRLHGVLRDADQARTDAEQARTAAERLRVRIDAGQESSGALERLNVQERTMLERDGRYHELLREADAARVAFGSAVAEHGRLRARAEARRDSPEALAWLREREQDLSERESRLQGLLREAEADRIAADEARAELSRLSERIAADQALALQQAAGRLQEQERILEQRDTRLRRRLHDAEAARTQTDEAQAELRLMCASFESESALREEAELLQVHVRVVRERQRLLCAGV